ncbi:MAG: hydroxyacid dehydrogenase [Candidatus Margulisbacteria bacterium GWF2_35_9]|nr:MAG: hydroxyacid dehydrogenase [Candidatus Margulisbacteria bacterium GWF2_35_9]
MEIAFFDSKPYDIESFNSINKSFGFSIKYFRPKLTPETAVLAKGYPVVCVFVNDTLNQEVIDLLYANGTKLIALRCAGYNNVDFKYAFNKILVVRVPAYSPYAVAEHAVALMLGLNRKTHKAYNRTRESNFNINGLLGFDLNNKTCGIIGTGKIGAILAKIMMGFGMNVLAYDTFPNKKLAEEIGFKYADLDKIYEKSDIISLHCPLTNETKQIVNSESINKMKQGVMLINTSRGQLVDTKALIQGLKSGKIGSAGLDVYEEESEYFFEDFSDRIITDDVLARLLSFNNVLITSHQAFFTKEALENIATTTLTNIKDFSEGKILTNEICYKCGQKRPHCNKEKTGRCFKKEINHGNKK